MSKSNRVVTHGFSLMAQGLTSPPLILMRYMPLLNLVAANIAGWVIKLNMHIYMMKKLDMYAACPDIPLVTISIRNII